MTQIGSSNEISLQDLKKHNEEFEKLLLLMDEQKDNGLDLTNEKHHEWAYSVADMLLSSTLVVKDDHKKTLQNIQTLENETMKTCEKFHLSFHLGIRLLKSKIQLLSVKDKNIHLTVIFAMYNEHNRVLTRKEHENGENFLLTKIKQLNWLFDNTNNSWELIGVDDGCPNNSGNICQTLLDKNKKNVKNINNCKIVYLQDAIDNKLKDFQDLKSTSDSRKGGSIHYGFYTALQTKYENKEHIIIYTDADLSADLGLSGSLIESIVCNSNIQMSLGDRYDDPNNSLYALGGSFGVKSGFTEFDIIHCGMRYYTKGILLPGIKKFPDTQCGFKAISRSTLESIYPKLKSRKFVFDMELMLTIVTNSPNNNNEDIISSVPIVWVYSIGESNVWNNKSYKDKCKPYYDMIQTMLKLNEKYFKNNNQNINMDLDLVKYFEKLTFNEYFNITEGLLAEKKNYNHFVDVKPSLEEMKKLMKVEPKLSKM